MSTKHKGLIKNDLEVIDCVRIRNHRYFVLRCYKCNNFIVRDAELFLSGFPKCDCEKRQWHGLSGTKLGKTFKKMLLRTTDPNNSLYKWYGGRGIKVCDEWLDLEKGFIRFYNWAMFNGYRDELTIDRIDVNGNYEPSNCRWVSMKEQANNRRSTVLIEYKGRTQSISQWATELNMADSTLRNRLDRGWSIDDAFNKPIEK